MTVSCQYAGHCSGKSVAPRGDPTQALKAEGPASLPSRPRGPKQSLDLGKAEDGLETMEEMGLEQVLWMRARPQT